jgi:hypothetical protein
MGHPATRIYQSETQRARAMLCEQREREAPDATSRREWTELAIEWHLLGRASQTSALLHANGFGLLPISFYVTDFLTVGKCRLAWRYRDDIGIIFERWLYVL